MEQREEGIPGWIVDAHTHILPPRLALKIRSFFTSQIRQASDSTVATIGSSSSTTCCGGSYLPVENSFDDKLEWTREDFIQHGPFELPYHPYDPTELTREITANGIDTIWVLPYAHKASISIGLNSAIVDVCSLLERGSSHEEDDKKGATIQRAITAFTVHPDDGFKGVEKASLQALFTGNARVAKLHCSVGRYSILNDNLELFWKLANNVCFPVVVHFGSSESGNTASQELSDIKELLNRYPNIRLIIAHSGHPALINALQSAMQFEHVYLDTTPVVTVIPSYPPRSHPLHSDLIQLARRGKILFGSDMPNVAVPLAIQIQSVFDTFADEGWTRPTHDKWWTQKQEAHLAGKAVEQVLFAAAHKLIDEVDVSKAQYQHHNISTNSSKM